MEIDLNRGVTIKTHSSGVQIYMYKDNPGVYLTAHGTEAPQKLAREAGFDVEKLRRALVKKERMAQALEAVEQEFSAPESSHKVIAEKDGFSVMSIGFGKHNLIDPDDNKINPRPLTKQEAMALLEKFTSNEGEGAKGDVTEGKVDKD